MTEIPHEIAHGTDVRNMLAAAAAFQKNQSQDAGCAEKKAAASVGDGKIPPDTGSEASFGAVLSLLHLYRPKVRGTLQRKALKPAAPVSKQEALNVNHPPMPIVGSLSTRA
jgi:hypothetical protein